MEEKKIHLLSCGFYISNTGDLDPDLYSVLQFCPDVQPGNARAKECLEEHREDTGFSPQCKTEIEKMMSERAADFRLDAKLRQLCSDDIDEICPYDKESLENVAGEEARVIECLQDYRFAYLPTSSLRSRMFGAALILSGNSS